MHKKCNKPGDTFKRSAHQHMCVDQSPIGIQDSRSRHNSEWSQCSSGHNHHCLHHIHWQLIGDSDTVLTLRQSCGISHSSCMYACIGLYHVILTCMHYVM